MGVPRASIVICTHNPTALLDDVLHALASQDSIRDTEILIIDNASTLPVTANRTDLPLHIIRENTLGLSHARNTGIAAATADLIIFLDDDALPEAGWLDALLQAATDHPETGSFGGYVQAVVDQPLPPWITPVHLRYFGSFDHGPDDAPLAYPEFPRGCNMMLRREALNSSKPFSSVFGKRGNRQSCYEEIDLCWHLQQRGFKSIYVAKARVRHVMSGNRLCKEWFSQRVFEQGKAERLFERRNGIRTEHNMLKAQWRSVLFSRGLERRHALGYLWGSVGRTDGRN